MAHISRRNTMTIMGAVALATPNLARAVDNQVTVWWSQGFYEQENKAIINAMADWEKRTGTKVNLSFMSDPDLISKLIAGMQTGDVPDLVHCVTADRFLAPRAAWNNQLEDVTDVLETQETELISTALSASRYYNSTKKQYSNYSIPIKCSTLMNNVWLPLVQDAGFSHGDIPKTQDAFYDFFQSVQVKLRDKGKRVFGLGYSMATKEADSGNLFAAFLVAYGGDKIVSADGKLNIDDPTVRKAAVTALDRLTTPYKKGYVPPGAINWGDVDNNNAFYAKQVVMTPNATISIAVAQSDKTDQYYKQLLTFGRPLGNDGKPMMGVLAVSPCLIPRGAKNLDGSKALLRDFIRPESLNSYLKETRARYLPVMMKNIKDDPYWTDPNDPHRPIAVQAGLIEPTLPNWMNKNPAYAQVLSEQIWSQAEANVTQKNMSVNQAVDEAAARMKVIFGKFQIG
jgi:multiple sugar transport system substrate-binding protein